MAEFPKDYKMLKNGKLLNKSKLTSLNPLMDQNGVIRVSGRLKNSVADFDFKYLVIFPKHHPFTKTVIRYYHVTNSHAGCLTLLSIVRSRFWTIDGKPTIRGVISTCIHCFKYRPKKASHLMGQLPSECVRPSLPFTHTDVDFCGPFLITTLKRVKAVHNLTTKSFLAALTRFVSRRGVISTIYSDNATNFVGANQQLKEIKELFFSKAHMFSVNEHCRRQGITWKFILPRSPHFEGLWEASVKLAKKFIRKASNQSHLHPYTIEEFETLVCQVEALINSRPITPVSDDVNDFDV